MRRFQWLEGGGFTLDVDPALLERIRSWLPLSAVEVDSPAEGVHVRVRAGSGAFPDPDREPTARLGKAALHLSGARGLVIAPGAAAEIHLEEGRAEVMVRSSAEAVDAHGPLHFSAALLLARSGRLLVHAGAVADGEAAWLLAGDSFSGKTTTALNLARAGWRLLSDDHVVLSRAAAGGWQVEGWPRFLHVDEGWPDGVSTGRRIPRDPREIPGVAMAASGRFAGLFLPRVERGLKRTGLVPVTHAMALSGLLRQSAWSVADPGAAPATLAAFAELTAHPAFALRLAPDTFRDPALLVARVREGVR